MLRRSRLISMTVLVGALCVTSSRAQVFEWVAVSSTGPSTIVGNEIILPAGGVQVRFDLHFSSWESHPCCGDLGALQATLDRVSFLGINASPPNPGVNLTTPELVACQSDGDCETGLCGALISGYCDDNLPAFQMTTACLDDQSVACSNGSQCPGTAICLANPAFVFDPPCGPSTAVLLPTNGNFEWIGACQNQGIVDTGVPKLFGSLRVDVPLNAEGTYTINLSSDPERTLCNGAGGCAIPGQPALVPGLITLPTDCNKNGILDDEEIANGQAADCDGNGLPDECDSGDCNANGRPDHCDILIGVSSDCNANELPDECEQDCNDNNTLDSCDIENMTSADCNGDGVPDECQLVANDCNTNDVPDDCDITDGPSADCNLNGVPDSCEPNSDCDTNGVQDICDVAAGAPDCNFNEVPDECEPDEDCNTNGVRDICDIGEGTALDCNGNGVPDSCDLLAGSSDTDGNNVPDECEVATPRMSVPPHHWRKNRFITFTPLITNNLPVAYRVELLDRLCAESGTKCMDIADCTVCNGGSRVNKPCTHRSECLGADCVVSGQLCVENSPPIALGWVGDPSLVPEDPDAGIPPDLFTSLVVKDQPSPRLWSEDVIHVGDCEIAPAQSYGVSATADGVVFSAPLVIGTIRKPLGKSWGDIVGTMVDTNGDGKGDTWTPPNGLVNVDDIVAWLRFKVGRIAPHITALELGGEVPNFIANANDLVFLLQGFKIKTYPPVPFANQGAVTECP